MKTVNESVRDVRQVFEDECTRSHDLYCIDYVFFLSIVFLVCNFSINDIDAK